MKSLYIFFICLSLTSLEGSLISAQNLNDAANVKLNEEKKTFVAKQVGISKTEATQFWPVYDDYLDKKNLLHSEKNKLAFFYKFNNKDMTANDVEVTLNRYLKIVKAESLLEEIFNKRFRKILPSEKVMKLYVAETEFQNTRTSNSNGLMKTLQ